ncbi:MAG: hypothetical protein MZV70_62230 [Desulfobacterales bacterium]|nr:hypothetical protein [Desulfobacterales bacterium]
MIDSKEDIGAQDEEGDWSDKPDRFLLNPFLFFLGEGFMFFQAPEEDQAGRDSTTLSRPKPTRAMLPARQTEEHGCNSLEDIVTNE